MKKLGIALVVLLVLVGGAVFWLHGGVDGLVRDAIVKYGSEMTQARVSVGKVRISALDGAGTIAELVIGNPKGFKSAHAFSVGEFTVVVEPASIAADVVTVKKIAIIAPDLMYEKNDATSNFDALQKNIADYVGPSENKASKRGKKLIISELTIRGAKAHGSASFLPGKTVDVSLPDLTLHDLGKAKGGVTPAELSFEIIGALKKQLTGAISIEKLGTMAKEAESAAGKTMEKASKLFK